MADYHFNPQACWKGPLRSHNITHHPDHFVTHNSFCLKPHGHHVCMINWSFLVLLLNSLTLTIFWTVPKKYTTPQDLIWYFFVLFCLACLCVSHLSSSILPCLSSTIINPFVTVISFIHFIVLCRFLITPSVSFQLTCTVYNINVKASVCRAEFLRWLSLLRCCSLWLHFKAHSLKLPHCSVIKSTLKLPSKAFCAVQPSEGLYF